MSVTKKAPITAVVITKNEGAAIEQCLAALRFCEQVLVVDSRSDDGTGDIGRSMGADVVDFQWDGRYPKKKQWGMEHASVRHDWVLHLDADEIVPPALARELIEIVRTAPIEGIVAAEIPLLYHFSGRPLRHGHRVMKRSLLDRRHCLFPEVGDLDAPGITEVEGHYQPICNGRTARTATTLTHYDPDPIGSWVTRHNRYADWEAYLRVNPAIGETIRKSRSAHGARFYRLPMKPVVFFLYSFVLRRGFLDGRAGFDYAFGLAWYYWLTDVKAAELRRLNNPTTDLASGVSPASVGDEMRRPPRRRAR